MRRSIPRSRLTSPGAFVGCVLAVIAVAVPGAAHASTTAPAVPSLGVRVLSCQTGVDARLRSAEFTAAMPAIADADRLALRFDLEQRRGGEWRPITVPGLGRWLRGVPGAAGFVFTKRVERLAAGASYRVAVRFRWTDAGGEVVRRATRRSAGCRQPDGRPDLAVTEVLPIEPLADGRARYVVRLRNAGPGAAPAGTRVTVIVDGVALAAQALSASLAAGATADVAFEGPACPTGALLTATADPLDDLEEPHERDNVLVVRC